MAADDTQAAPAASSLETPVTNATVDRMWHEGFMFSGTGGEYFGIWIVNILLSVLSLGIYSAWAKVRRMQFFYRNTQLAGAGFDYHANPWAILKGRLIAGGIMSAYYGLAFVSPIAGGVAFVVVLGLMPWFITRALRFRLYNTSYRGLRFRFTGTTADAYKVFVLWPLATVLTLGLLGPMWHQRLKRYVHSNAWYGRTPFSFHATLGSFYGVYLQAFGLLAAFVAVGGALAGPFFVGAMASGGSTRTIGIIVGVLVAVLLYLSGSLTLWAFTTSRIQNLAWNNTHLGPHQFVSSIGAGRLAFITVTNLLGVALTLGFYKPFAVVRLTEYFLSQSRVAVSGSLNDFVAGEKLSVGAAGEEAVEMFDLDLAV